MSKHVSKARLVVTPLRGPGAWLFFCGGAFPRADAPAGAEGKPPSPQISFAEKIVSATEEAEGWIPSLPPPPPPPLLLLLLLLLSS